MKKANHMGNEESLLSSSFSTTTSDSSTSDLPEIDSLFMEENYRSRTTNIVIEQFVANVADFSSQYGSDYSISYTALNITGRPSKFPDYGDFPETFAMRTYGNWWNMAPSKLIEIQSQNELKIPAHDFIIVKFEELVVPDKIKIYETYNPGALVRIWLYSSTEQWVLLWQSEPKKIMKKESRALVIELRKTIIPTNTIRLEFNHNYLDYFTEIDGVTLIGRKCRMRPCDYFTQKKKPRKGFLLRTLENIKFKPSFNKENNLRQFLTNDLEKFIQESININFLDNTNNTHLGLKDMPFDIVLKIYSYLDLISLFRIGRVSKSLYEVSQHPLLYTEINLKPYWNLSNSDLLCTLATRATLLKKLDLSWCGIYNSICPTEFKTFIQQRGDNLTHLRLNSCKFLNASCLETVGIVCDNLKELSLRNYSTDPPILNFSCLGNLKNLERLDLFRTYIETDLLLTMLENNKQLKHLNLAFCGIRVNMDEIAVQISKYNKELISVDMWKSHSLSSVGLQALSVCTELEEVDFGWCLREEASPGESLRALLKGAPKLKKIFLAAIRGLVDRDIENISMLCSNLEQLDLMGVLGISTERCYEILMNCKKLKLFDLSFCDNIDDNQVALWRERFKDVSIKRSCVHADAH